MELLNFQKFNQGECTYKGLMEEIKNITSFKDCKNACSGKKQCEYFVYNEKCSHCKMFASTEKTCSVIKGPSTPSPDDCLDKSLTFFNFEILQSNLLCLAKKTLLFAFSLKKWSFSQA